MVCQRGDLMSLRGSMRGALGVYVFIAVELLTACPNDNETRDAGASDAAAYSGDGGASSDAATTCSKSRTQRVDKLDLLLVVDNSNSMQSEQRALVAQLPTLIKTLTTGVRKDNDPAPFPPVKDMHVGVVSSDMGIPGVEWPPSCAADGGDDGKLLNTPHGENCEAQYPSWLSFNGDANLGAPTDPLRFANDIACIAALGTAGCGFEQQLEAPLKALMPKVLKDASGNVITNPYSFLASDPARSSGRGDMPVAEGGNAGFLRSSMAEGSSLIAIVVLTDEEDCSVRSTAHLTPNSLLPEDSPYRKEDVNLRCFKHKEFLYDLEQRYLHGFRALRPGREDLVLFAVIAGVPTELIKADVDLDDAAQREQLYNTILSDSRMQEIVDPNREIGDGRLMASCSRPVAGASTEETAFPPRRLVELARMFGANGLVQSICQDDFSAVTDALVDRIAKRLIAINDPETCKP